MPFQSNFVEITLRHVCTPVNLLHIFRIPFSKNTSAVMGNASAFNYFMTESLSYRNQINGPVFI